MRITPSLHRAPLLVVGALLLTGTSGCLGCRAESEAPAIELRRQFPDQAAQVLEARASFEAGAQSFLRSPSAEPLPGNLDVVLPRDGADVIRFRLPGGLEVQVRELGAMGEGTLAEGAVAYRRAGGTSFWTATPGGAEEWLHLEAGVARAGETVATWEIQGAALRQGEDAVLLLDEAGVPRLRVTAPKAYVAGGHEVEARLTVQGNKIELSVAAGGEAVLVDPAWAATGMMLVGRDTHTATLLANGEVLAVGGYGAATILTSTERYNPANNTWSLAAPMSIPRAAHTATLLPNGRVLVAGGTNLSGQVASTEIYNPTNNTWSLATSMSTARQNHIATLLGTGEVLVAGGYGTSAYLASAERYNPMSDTWTVAAPMGTARWNHTETLLQSGQVLVAGGQNMSGYVGNVERYDPASNAWAPAGTLTAARHLHAAALLGNGNVLVTGGYGMVGYLASIERYDPVGNTWSVMAPMATARSIHTATLLDTGLMLVTGGDGAFVLASTELYDPTGNVWTPTPSLATGRYYHTATKLNNGKVLVAGGNDAVGPLSTSELYSLDPSATACTNAALCQSGFCVDGVCCDLACTGPCTACTTAKKGAGANGVCGPILAGNDPDNECATQAASTCGTTGTCDGAGACQNYTAGTVCAAASCAGPSTQNNPDTCNGSGTCVDNATQSCGNYLCSGTACLSTCVSNAECTSTAYCSAPTCLAKKLDGLACAAANQCVSGNCVDGVCCNTACNGLCMACTSAKQGAGMDGTCGPIQVLLDSDNECTAQPASTCGTTGFCDGAGACQKHASGTICTLASCMGTTLNKADLCDGNGTCVDQGTQSCAPSMCANLACPGPCVIDLDCGPSNYCNAGTCAGKQTQGAACAGANQCASGSCADGFCCDTACNAGICDACSMAAGAATNGTCALLTGPVCDDGDACTQANTCQAGVCVGSNPKICSALDACHVVGTCNPATGACSNPATANGTLCPGGKCNAGTCVLELDSDGDGFPDVSDNCPTIYTTNQNDLDKDKLGDACDGDLDGDGFANGTDHCPTISSPTNDPAVCQCNKPDGVPCDDGNLCTLNDSCLNKVCTSTPPLSCPLPGQVIGTCEISACIPAVGGCSVFNKVDGAPCKDKNDKFGVCIAGGCLIDSGSGASGSGSAGGTGGGSSASTGNGSGGVSSTSSTGTTMSSGSAATGAGAAGAGGSEEIRLHGGCSLSGGQENQGPESGAPWLLLGSLLAMRRRRSVARAVTLIVGAALLGGCKDGAAEISTLTITPPAPLTMEKGALLQLASPDAVNSPQQVREMEELLTMQRQRTPAQATEASAWQESAVIRWNEIARGLVAKYNTSPPVASRLYALLSVAQHDALVSAVHNHRIHKRPPPSSADQRLIPLFAAKVDSTYPSDHAAVAAASMAVLAYVYQSKAEVDLLTKKAADHEESRLWAGVSYRSDIVAGDRIGHEVAARIIQHATTDGAKPVLPWPGTVPTGDEMWFSSETPAVAPLRPAWGAVRPWLMTSGGQFRPEPPPARDSPAFGRAVDELVQLSRTRTPEQLRVAQFWADGPSSPTPPGHWNQIAADLIRQHPGSQLSAARVLAFLNMAVMDAGISCWDAKFTYWLIRPSQVDPTITIPIGLPNFPSYPSGHSTFSGAASVVLGHFFPSEQERLAEMAEEASMSRVYGGIHYRFDGETGLAMGRSVGELAIEKEKKERRE